MEALWAAAARLQPLLDRSDPSTWGATDAPPAQCCISQPANAKSCTPPVDVGERWEPSAPQPDGGRGPHRFDGNGQWRFHCLGTGADAAGPRCPHTPLETAEAFLDATSRHPMMLAQVEAFVGGEVMRPRRNRGICASIPAPPDSPLHEGSVDC